MASLGTTFDATAVDPTTAFEILPPGKYVVQIVGSEMRPTRDGGGQYLWFELDVLEGALAGRKLFDRLNLVNSNAQAVEIAQRTLSAICHATGRLQVRDSAELHLIPMTADIMVQPPRNGYPESNKIRYLPLERAGGAVSRPSKPSIATGISAQNSAPPTSEPTAPAPTFASAPWKRSS